MTPIYQSPPKKKHLLQEKVPASKAPKSPIQPTNKQTSDRLDQQQHQRLWMMLFRVVSGTFSVCHKGLSIEGIM